MKTNENLIRQYEAIRQSGLANMFDRNKVQEFANEMDYTELAGLTKEEYGQLLQSYSELMEKFGITKEDKQIQLEVIQINNFFGDSDEDKLDDEEDWDWCGTDEDEEDEEWEDEEFED